MTNSAKDYTHKRPFAEARLPVSMPLRDFKTLSFKESSLYTAVIRHDSNESAVPTKKKQRLQSLADIPNEILLTIQSNLTRPQDLLSFSQTCTLFRELTDDGAWCRAYKNLSKHWAQGTEVGHLRGNSNMWRQVVMDDHLRKTLHWIVPDTTDTAAQEPEQVRLRIDLEQATHIKPSYMHSTADSEASRWRNVGPPASHTDPFSRATLCAYMQTCTYEQHTNYQVAIYGLPDHKTPLACIKSDFWTHPEVDRNLDPDFAPENLVAQLMDVKQFPDQRDDQGRIRVVLVLAFGERNVAPLGSEEGDVQFLDTWLLIKVVDIYICDTPHTTLTDAMEMEEGPRLVPYRPDPYRLRVETIVPSTRHELIRGRAVRLYSTTDPLTGESQDRIALFGIFLGARIRAIVMTSPLFVSSLPERMQNISLDSNSRPPSKWKSHLLGDDYGLEASCLALFPPQCDFEHLMVVLDRKGRGEIWDWMNVSRVAELEMVMDDDKGSDGISSQETHEEIIDRSSQELGEEVNHRQDLHYWGVQVNWTVEEPLNNIQETGHRQHGDFRIVALADGQNKEWEVCWWHVSEQELRKELANDTPESGKRMSWVIESSSRHFEAATEFKTWPPRPQEKSEPGGNGENHLLFIAYLIWDHYRIALTSQYGLCLFDMNQELPGDILGTEPPPGHDSLETQTWPRHPQWVTMIDDANDDPLIDIATVGDCLFLTRKYTHMIWPFRRILGKQTSFS
ncbi:hypothetical protein BGX34_011025 [Mortierella sp. NVP85]|nr:hypothetical protein BGX34_011025 [Mortierella sp. NVP85]